MPKYDDVEWHEDPRELSGVPIGVYLAWLSRGNLLARTSTDPATDRAIKARTIGLADLAAVFDGKLVSNMMTPVGDQFTAATYRSEFLPLWEAQAASFQGSLGQDGGWAAYTAIAPALDTMFRLWQTSPLEDGSMAPEPDAISVTEATGDLPRGISVNLLEDAQGLPHEAPDLERRLSMATGASHVNSIVGVKEPKLRSALKNLGIPSRVPISAYAFVSPHGGINLAAIQVQGLGPDMLRSVLRDTVFTERGARWERRTIRGHDIEWASGPRYEAAVWLDGDGVAFHAAGPRQAVESVVEQLLPAPGP